MIDYQTYCQIRQLYTEKKLGLRQIARELALDLKTVRKWAKRESFQKAPVPTRESKLDAFKGEIVRLLERHDYSVGMVGVIDQFGPFIDKDRPGFFEADTVLLGICGGLQTVPLEAKCAHAAV